MTDFPPSLHHSPHSSVTPRQQDQLRRFLYPSLSSTASLPFLLPLPSEVQREAAWIQVDLHAQLLLAQVLRTAILPWYSKLTNDRELVEEVAAVIGYGLRSSSESLMRTSRDGHDNGSVTTRLENFLLYDAVVILQLHYVEVRRAKSMSIHKHEREGAILFLASNPHPALSLNDQSELQLDESYVDLLLLAVLQAVLPPGHFSSQNEVLIIMDVIKGVIRGQLRIHGRGNWVVVRMLSGLLDAKRLPHSQSASSAVVLESRASRWYDSSNLLSGLSFVSAVLNTVFLYLGVIYLDFFTPLAEPKPRIKRRQSGRGRAVERPVKSQWNMELLLELIVEALDWRRRILTRFLEEWIQIGLAWGGSRFIQIQIKKEADKWSRPENLTKQMAKLHDVLLRLPNQPPPMPAQVPDINIQREEYDKLLVKLVETVQQWTALALLLGHDEASQKRCINRAMSPFLEPPTDPTCASIIQVANAKSLLALLEQIAILINPALKG